MTALTTTQPTTREREFRAVSLVAMVPLALMVLSQFLPGEGWRDRSPFDELRREPFVIVFDAPFFGVPLLFVVCTAFAALRGYAPGKVAYAFAAFSIASTALLAMFVCVLLYKEQHEWSRGAGFWLAVPWPFVSLAVAVRAGWRRGWERWAWAITALTACSVSAAFGALLIDAHQGLNYVWTCRLYAIAIGCLAPLAIWTCMPRRDSSA